MTGSGPRPGHRLAAAQSPFLRHGATQPVDWYPWGEAAFDAARSQNRPVLLDVGAVWCHWCHVMDAESYDDEDTATLINELFVPVKVDRDELPDVDARYQRAVQTMAGQGGWPLTAFLTPDGEVFYGGTYFPPDDRFGRPSFQRVLREVARLWREEPERAHDAAGQIRARLDAYAQAEVVPGGLDVALIATTLDELAHTFDFRHGGFGRAPKFPNAGALDLLLDEYLDHDTAWAERIVVETLDAMAAGGIHDQLGGGFHRYATDARWLIPHFEKMAYDNGVLMATYARAAAALDEPAMAAVAAGVAAYYTDIAAPLLAEGGFPASQDADYAVGDDGDYWTWTLEEVRAVLDGDEQLVRVATLCFGLDDAAAGMHHDPTRRVLYRARGAAAVARALDIDETTAAERVALVKARLKRARDVRPRPYVDETLYGAWVALVASGHLAAARHAGVAGAADSALRALDRAVRSADADGVITHRLGDTDSGDLLEDHAALLQACVDAFEWTQEAGWLDAARRLADVLLDRYADVDTGALRDRPTGAAGAVPALARAYLPIADAPSPSGNALAALGLTRLAAYTGESAYGDAAQRVLRAFAGSAQRLTSSAATYVKALAWHVADVTSVVVVEAEERGPLLTAALAAYRPRTTVRRLTPGATPPAGTPPELAAMVSGNAPRAYVCAGRTCAAPITEPGALRAALRSLRG